MKDKHQEIFRRIQAAKKIVITSHKSPDGDSIGSSMGLYQWIRRFHPEVHICHPDPFPNYLAWVSDVASIQNYEDQPEQVIKHIQEADLIFALDYNHPSRMGEMGKSLEGREDAVVMIDHHTHPSAFASLAISQPECCSTAQLIFELIYELEPQAINPELGSHLYLGIMTDTGSFRFSSVEPRTHEILAFLLRAGVPHTKIHEQVFDQVSLSQLKLKSYAINQKLELFADGQIALLSLTNQELAGYHYEKGDTEGLVNTALSIEGVKMAIFAQEKEGAVKISFRSKHEVKVNILAQDHFEGGGHIYAAGGISYIGMPATLQKIKENAPLYL